MEYGLLGEHLKHSWSQQIHSELAAYKYELIEKSPAELEEFMRSGDFRGLNVTIPYKTAVMPYISSLSERARKIGSVNTVVRRGGELYGDNTDYAGFMYMLSRAKFAVRGKKVLVLGSGGASLAVCAVLGDLGAAVTVISRRGENNYENLSRHSDADFIINTTPVGMYPNNGERPLDLSRFTRLSGVADIIYNPAKTALMLQAEELKIPCTGGLPMLVAQAAYASELFCGRHVPGARIEAVLRSVSRQMKNIVLIGMPGCGKTAVGKRLSALLGRELSDLDLELEKIAGKTAGEMYSEDGEDAMRALETKCAAEAGRRSGIIIACGGGIVTRPENKNLLLQNGIAVYINRPIHRLATKGRPISQQRGVAELARERIPLYKSWATVTVENIGVGGTAALIISFLGLKRKKKGTKE